MVGLVARGGDGRLAGTAAVEFDLEIGFGERNEGRAPVDHDPDSSAVRFAEGGDAEESSEGAGHAERMGDFWKSKTLNFGKMSLRLAGGIVGGPI